MTHSLACAATARALALTIISPARAGSVDAARPIEGPFGKGADAVWLIPPSAPARRVVGFAHGWKSHLASTSDEWLQQFRPWLDYLVARGSAVIFPRSR